MEAAARDFGYLVLAVNDLEDIAMIGDKHDALNDFGSKMSLPWWHFMHLALPADDPLSADLAADQATIAKLYDDLAQKRRFGIELDETNKAQLAQAGTIGNKYLTCIAQAMRQAMEVRYVVAKKAVEEACRQLPVRDVRNRTLEEIFNTLLDEAWEKFCRYGAQVAHA